MSDNGSVNDDLEFSSQVREALSTWLQWNEGYSRLVATMYTAKDRQELEHFGDELDQLRYRAVELTKRLLGVL